MVETKAAVIRRDSIREGHPSESGENDRTPRMVSAAAVAVVVRPTLHSSSSSSSSKRRLPIRRQCVRILRLLQFQLAMAVVGVMFWAIPYGMDMGHDQMASSERGENIFDPVNSRRRKTLRPRHPPAHRMSFTVNAHRQTGPGAAARATTNGRQRRRRARDFNRYPRVIFFVHIHKGAGTMFCSFADMNGATVNKQQNCNVQQDQRCCGNSDTIDAQVEYAKQTMFDVVAIEREMYETMAPDYYDYVVTLRESQSRYYSHWKHLRRMMPIGPGVQTGGFGDSSWIYGTNVILDIDIKKRNVPIGMDPLGNFTQWYEGQPDNWNTRILCGPRCRPQSKFQITESLFHYALTRLEIFSHFLFVEDMEASYNKFAAHYNLRVYSDIISSQAEKKLKHSNQHNHTAKNQRSLDRSPENADERTKRSIPRNETHGQVLTNTTVVDRGLWDPLMSALDDALYEFARRKYQNMTHEQLWRPFSNQVQVDRYFVEGPQMGCHDVCCGRCTAY